MDNLKLTVPGMESRPEKNDRKPVSVSFQLPKRSSEQRNHVSKDNIFPMMGSPQIATSSNSGRHKVKLEPHHSALDWEHFKHSNNVKSIDPSSFPIRLTKAELLQHNTREDCWMALGGKIYNISKYLDYHPGGAEILLKYAGRDGTALFTKYHRWVSYERILDECFIGFLV